MFDAGSIVAKLELDRDPFQRGLEAARADAEEFERSAGRTIRPQLKPETDETALEKAKARLDVLRERVTANVGVDTGEARAETAALDRELRSLHRKVQAQVGVDGVPETLVEIETVQHELDKIDHRRVKPNVESGGFAALTSEATRASGKISTLALTAATLGPALVPVGAAAVGAVGALGGAFAGAGAGLGAFALVAMPALKNVEAAATKTGAAQKKAMAALGPGGAAAVQSLKSFDSAWHHFAQSFQPQVFGLMNIGLSTARSLLPALRPLISNTADALTGLAREASRALQGPYWQRFFSFLSGQAGPAITTFGRVLGNLAHGFAGLLQAFSPLIGPMEQGLQRLSASFAQWGASVGQTQGFQRFLDYIRQNAPLVLRTIGDLAKTIADIGPAFAHSGVSSLKLVDGILRLTDGLLKSHPVIGQMMATIAPFAVVMLKFAGPIGSVVRAISSLTGVAVRMAPLFAAAFEAAGGAVVALAATIGAPVAVVVAAIAAVIAIGVLVVTHWDDVKRLLAAAWGAIKDVAVAVFGFVKKLAQDGLLGPIPLIISRWGEVKAFLVGAWREIEGVAKTVWNAIKTAVTTAVTAAVDFVRDHWKLLPAIFLGPLGAVATIFLKFHTQITDTVKTVVGDVVRFFGELPGRMLRIGEDVVRGLINGIRNMAGAVSGAIGDVVHGALDSAKGLLGIHSPSTIFHGFGLNIAQGLANGITAGAPAAIGAAASLAANVSEAMRQQLAVAGAQANATPFMGIGGDIAKGAAQGRITAAGEGDIAAHSWGRDAAYHQRYEDRKNLGLTSLAGVTGKDLHKLAAAGLYGGGDTYNVAVTMPTPVASGQQPDAGHFAALLGQSLRATGKKRGR